MKLFREHTTNLIGQCVSRGTSTVLWLEEHMTASTVQQSERSVEGHTFSNDNTESQSVRIDRGKEGKTVQQIEWNGQEYETPAITCRINEVAVEKDENIQLNDYD